MISDIKNQAQKIKLKVQERVDDGSPEKSESARNVDFMNFVRIILVAAILLIFGMVILTYGIYSKNWQNYFIEAASKIIPFPAASVSGKYISLSQYNENNKAMRKFLETKDTAYGEGKFDFSTEEGLRRLMIIKKNVLNELIEAKIVELIAKKEGIYVSEKEAFETAEKIISRDGKENDNLTELKFLYGWGKEDFAKKVILPLLYRENLEKYIEESGNLDSGTKDKALSIKNKIDQGEDFAVLAKNHSDSPSRETSGLLPPFSKEETPFVQLKSVFDWQPGEVGEPFETDDGWHIIKLERKFIQERIEKVEIRHIFLRKKSFSEWLEKQKENFKVRVYLDPYFWHEKMGRIYFKDQALNEAESQFNRSYYEEKANEADFLLNVGNLENLK